MRRTTCFFLGIIILTTTVGALSDFQKANRCAKEYQAWLRAKSDVETEKYSLERAKIAEATWLQEEKKARERRNKAMFDEFEAESLYGEAQKEYFACLTKYSDVEQDMACLVEHSKYSEAGAALEAAHNNYVSEKEHFAETHKRYLDAMDDVIRIQAQVSRAIQKQADAWKAYRKCLGPIMR